MKEYTVTVNASVTIVGVEADSFGDAKNKVHAMIKDDQVTLSSCYIEIQEG